MAKEHPVHSDIYVIAPTRDLRLVDPLELWRWHELFLALIVRDVAVRYKQTAIGVAWVVIQPLAMVAIFSFLLGKIGNVPTGGLPYPLFAFAAMVPWQVFSRALVEGSMSLAGNRSLVTKVYFPRILMPAAAVFGGAVDFGITLVILLAMMMWFGFVPGWQILLTRAEKLCLAGGVALNCVANGRRTGCSVLVNTSFNVRGEPIVCTPEDAFRCFMGTEIEVLAAGNCLLEKEAQDLRLRLDYKNIFSLD